MNRMTKLIAAFFFVVATLAYAQDVQSSHPFPEDAFSTKELVAWSHLQTPQPAPKPLPVPDAQVPRPDQQRASADTQLFVGKVIKDSGAYLLQVAASIYRLDGEVDARDENQAVRILGSRETTGAIRIVRIERL
jgi:hypothetical protein